MIEDKLCEVCGNPFLPRRWWQKYCSRDCNSIAFWSRKHKQTTSPLDVLEVDDKQAEEQEQEPQSALMEAERERRKALKEEIQDMKSQKVADMAEEILRQRRDLPSALEELGYGSAQSAQSAEETKKEEEP